MAAPIPSAVTDDAIPAPSRDRIPQLDGLRGIAIALVLGWHYLAAVPGGDASTALRLGRRAFLLGWSGVDLFFVLSGYLIGGILLDNRDSPRYFRTFYVRRAFRILPAYLLLLLPFLSARRALGSSRNPVMAALLGGDVPSWSYVAFVQNLFMAAAGDFGALWTGVTWSLAIEEQFYLLLPLALFVVPRRLVPRLCVTCAVLALVFRTVVTVAFEGPRALASVYVLLPSRMDGLFLGVLGAWLMREPWGRAWLVARRGRLLAFLAAAGAVLCVAAFRQTSFVAPWMTTGGYTLLALFYLALVLAGATASGGPLYAVLTWWPLRMLGYTSYFVYLFHELFLHLAHFFAFGQPPLHTSAPRVLATASAFVALMAAAAVSWRVIEQPLLAEGRKARY
jgi:peptidoglycan/LPS O-acetylase OafA/YrhL